MRASLAACFALALATSPAARADDPKPHVHGGDDAADAGASGATTDTAKVPMNEKHNLDAASPKLHGQDLELKVGEETAKAYVARVTGKKHRGAVLVFHEWWGLNDHIKHQADELARHGYLALAIDLYKGQVATDPKTAGELMGKLDEVWGDKVEEAAREWLKTEGKVEKVATIGWCMGGGQSLRASLHDPKDVWATVIYYGMPVADVAQLKTLQGPVLGIWANKDGWITPEKVKEFEKALTEAGIKHEFHAYDADHAFANPSNGPKYNGKDAKDAWKKTLSFLDKNAK